MNKSRLVNRNVVAGRGRTSMRLEPELWEALSEICGREKTSLADIIKHIEGLSHPGGRPTAVRVFFVGYYRQLLAPALARSA